MGNNRSKGNRVEIFYRNVFRDLGFKHCVTSRFGSKIADHAKIDLINIPFNIQIKAGVQKCLSPAKELQLMEDKLTELFPPGEEIHTKPKFLIHKKQLGTGKNYSSELVYMSKKQFDSYLLKGAEISDFKLKVANKNFNPDSEFKVLVVIDFGIFIKEIVKKFYLCL